MEEQQSPFQAAIRPGLTIGLVSLAITYIVYFIDSSMLISGWFGLVAIVIFFALIIYFGREYRTELGGFMTFGTAFNFSFITIVISGLVGFVGQILLYQVIDPTLGEVLADKSVENTLAMMERFGAPADAMGPDQIEEMRKATADGFTLVGQLKAFGIALVVYAIIALILGAILKKKDKSLDY